MSDSVPATAATREPDPYGQAALMLVESLIHGLAARNVISVAEAIEIMEVALEAQMAIADDADPPSPGMRQVADLLAKLMASLETDLRR